MHLVLRSEGRVVKLRARERARHVAVHLRTQQNLLSEAQRLWSLRQIYGVANFVECATNGNAPRASWWYTKTLPGLHWFVFQCT